MTPATENSLMRQIMVGAPLGKGTGSITAADVSEQAVHALAKTINEQFMVDVSGSAAGCCIDGRCALHTMAGENTMLPIGPHAAGGPLFTAFGAAELVPGYYGEQSAVTGPGRLEEVKDTLSGAGVPLGAHVTDSAIAHGFTDDTGKAQTGCGLNDKFKLVMKKPAEEKDFVYATAQLLLGEEKFDAASMRFHDEAAVESRIRDYDSKQALDIFIGHEKAFDHVEVLTGEHAEQLVVFNYVEGKTVDRDALVTRTGKQVFVIDMWYLDKLATAMATGRPDAVAMRSKLLHAMTAFQVATYLTLCDGTHRPVIMKPEETAVAAA